MQGERANVGSLSDALNFEHGSSSNNAVVDQQNRWENINNLGDNGDTTFSNSVYHEQRDLHRFNLGEASSSGTKNEAASHSEQWMQIGSFEERRKDNLELNPLFVQPSSGNRVARNVNLNAEYNEHLDDMNPVIGYPAGLIPENSVRAGSSVDGRRASCKRKALDASIGQSSSSGGFREFHRGESSSWTSAPAFYSPGSNDLSISLGPRGLVPNLSAPANTERFSVRVNPTVQQETVFSAGSVIQRPVAPSFSSPGHLPADQQLRYHALGNVAPQNTNAFAIGMPSVSRNMIPPFQWSGSPAAAGESPSSAAPPVDRNVVQRVATRQRSNMLENPLFVQTPELRNLALRNLAARSMRNGLGAGHVASSSSRTNVQPSPSIPAWTPYQPSPSSPALNPYQTRPNQRRLHEHLRRSLLSSLVTNQRAGRSLVPAASSGEHVLQSGGGNTFQAQNQAYSRAGPRQMRNATGAPHSSRGLASTSQGRRGLATSEIRNILEHMRRSGNLRFEEVMLLNQSMAGGADNHDRYRDMRLDVDNMTYEELLSLEERIGDVCTGLNEETISNRLKQHKYNSSTSSQQEVEPCCICQEEYKEGEEMGMLECGHDFHSQCIKEWLMRKNLCPICKTTGLNTAEKPRG
ncbi:hypothetical protein EUTSA_v10011314mg [Eutrema salsugineum]|uniref:RING-type E3 ubiquitin transferase n=1 Tax=Eutrema salsugineum TaxID=72664 RepID=V4KLZ5_EUTSA|nr:probable E3 ubiquitin-protein ligase RHG1A [Eutrema salsugineum]XP_024006079.1 probable E3 ubiquitin-protein ligase RHG1A [Eutrema salsugineum]XP_024006080.1 probable E3 ubiquitin-protein ligase RHG1A [Eutrema salsugineum]ESQ30946.1 hypothetical protein EUTSA_v10011314mg [Eutrema salsugineum]ESQ30947.1 hypothetical protein EUTSA_v10011314mg [Eutrema salsugineum]